MELHFLGRGAVFTSRRATRRPISARAAVCCCSTAAKRLLPIFCGAARFLRVTDITRRPFASAQRPLRLALWFALPLLLLICCTSSPIWFSRRTRPIARTSRRFFACSVCRENAFAFGGGRRRFWGFSSFRSFRYVPTRHSDGCAAFPFIFETENGGVFFRRIPVRRKRSPRSSSNRIRILSAPTWIPRTRTTPAISTFPSGGCRSSRGEARPRLYDASQPRRVRRSRAGVLRLFPAPRRDPLFPFSRFYAARFYRFER